MIDPLTFAIGTVWGVVTLWAWTTVLIRRYRWYQEWHDARARRELILGFGLWMLAVLMAAVLFVSAIRDVADVGSAVRGVTVGLGMGCFTGVGVMAALDRR